MLLQELVDLEKMSVSKYVGLPPHLKSLSSSIIARQDSWLSSGRSGREPKDSPSSVVATVANSYPPAMTRPHDSELPYPLRRLPSAIVPEMTHSSKAAV